MSPPRVLVAGIGNIFLGDDAFGSEVARRLAQRPQPPEVRVVDFGIRGFDLAFALIEGCDVAILVDAIPQGNQPGSLHVIEPNVDELPSAENGDLPVQGHAMHPVQVLRLAKSLGGTLPKLLLVGCEPADLGPEEGKMGLSESVAAAVEKAVVLVESIVAEFIVGRSPK